MFDLSIIYNATTEQRLKSKELDLHTLVCLINNDNHYNTRKKEVEERISYKKVIKAIGDNKLKSKIKNCSISLSGTRCPHNAQYIIDIRDFVTFCLNHQIEIDIDFLDYFNWNYWARKEIWTFDEAVTILCLPDCPFPHEIINNTILKEKTEKLAQELWHAISKGKLGNHPGMHIDHGEDAYIFFRPQDVLLSPIKVLKWYVQEENDSYIVEFINSILLNSAWLPIENSTFCKIELVVRVLNHFLVINYSKAPQLGICSEKELEYHLNNIVNADTKKEKRKSNIFEEATQYFHNKNKRFSTRSFHKSWIKIAPQDRKKAGRPKSF